MNLTFLCLVFSVFCVNFSISSDTYCDGTGWTQYGDEKCYKLIKKWATRDEAKDLCTEEWLPQSDASTPQLVAIKSVDEQNYLNEFVYGTSEVRFNVWIGAKRVEQSNKFVWNDGSTIEYSNWANENPSEINDKSCVLMQSIYTKSYSNDTEINRNNQLNGKWRDVICDTVNYVICQKLQRWSFAKLQQNFLETRKALVDTQNELTGTTIRLNSKIDGLEKNPVPIGFIYVQLSSQPNPTSIWPKVQWQDVTLQYEGLFFRAEGGESAQFGTEQEANAPRVTEVRFERHTYPGANGDPWRQTILNVGGMSSGIGVFSGAYCCQQEGGDYTHRFYQSGGEVRPRNMAMRIWKRIA